MELGDYQPVQVTRTTFLPVQKQGSNPQKMYNKLAAGIRANNKQILNTIQKAQNEFMVKNVKIADTKKPKKAVPRAKPKSKPKSKKVATKKIQNYQPFINQFSWIDNLPIPIHEIKTKDHPFTKVLKDHFDDILVDYRKTNPGDIMTEDSGLRNTMLEHLVSLANSHKNAYKNKPHIKTLDPDFIKYVGRSYLMEQGTLESDEPSEADL